MEEQKNSQETTQQAHPAPKRKLTKKSKMTLGVVLAVVVVAGAGFWVWHEQPSFCNAFCHNMDPYLPTYEAEPGQPTTDKWGNQVADASGMLSAVHRDSADATCMSCHIPSLEEQVTEGLRWVSGDYVDPLDEKATYQLTAYRGVDGDQFCLNEACHNMTRPDLVKATSSLERNPHVAQHGDLDCGTCHKAHRASVMTCTQCHDDAVVPQGWISAQEASSLGYQYH